MKDPFHKLAAGASHVVGRPFAFISALALLVGWLATGPLFGYSDTWQLIVNTVTTIVTFMMVFLIQNTQNRDALSFHLKLDELIRATRGARNSMIDLSKLSDAQLQALEREFERICAQGDPSHGAGSNAGSGSGSGSGSRHGDHRHSERGGHAA